MTYDKTNQGTRPDYIEPVPKTQAEIIERFKWAANRMSREQIASALEGGFLPTAKEQHLMDVYDSLGVTWGHDVFHAIGQLRAASQAVCAKCQTKLDAGVKPYSHNGPA